VVAKDYIGGLVFVGGARKFIQTEEGRILLSGSQPEYQYNITDHLACLPKFRILAGRRQGFKNLDKTANNQINKSTNHQFNIAFTLMQRAYYDNLIL
jgi:hypothetical protein